MELQEKCKYSQRWLNCFKKWHGIHLHTLLEEKESADFISASECVKDFEKFMREQFVPRTSVQHQ